MATFTALLLTLSRDLPDRLQRNPVPDSTSEHVEKAATELARQVGIAWVQEAKNRKLHDPAPLAVRWKPVHDDIVGHAGLAGEVNPGRADQIGSLVRDFNEHCRRRLVILGASGSGKSDIALLLLLALLEIRTSNEPVPVLFSASTWDPENEDVKAWLERRLHEAHPNLGDTTTYGATVARELVVNHRILLILDGLDELTRERRKLAIPRLNEWFGGTYPLVVTCGTAAYYQAVADSNVLTAAAIVELEPALTADTIEYLADQAAYHRDRWKSVFGDMSGNEAGPLARALSSTLMTVLARDAYASPDSKPGDLAGLESQTSIEKRLLGSLIPSRFDRPAGRWDGSKAEHWLTDLAKHLTDLGTTDLVWWRLRRAVPALQRRRWQALLPALTVWVTSGSLFGLAQAFSSGFAFSALTGLQQGFDAAVSIGPAYLFMSSDGSGTPSAPFSMRRLHPFLRTPLTAITYAGCYGVETGLSFGVTQGPAAGLMAGVINLAVAALLLGLAIGSRLFAVAEKPTYVSLRVRERRRSLVHAMVSRAVAGGLVGALAGYGVRLDAAEYSGHAMLWIMGIPGGAIIGLGFALVSWARTAGPTGEAASPISTLRADRTFVLLLGVPFGILFPVCYGIGFSLAPDGGLRYGLRYGVYGLAIGLAMWIAIAFTRAWPWYLVTVAWLALHGRIPWRLFAFLDEAHQRQVLRQAGDVYQFRHARMQDHLADTSMTGAEPRSARLGV